MFQRHGIRGFEVVDNMLNIEQIRLLLSELRSRPNRFSLFYETKDNLKLNQVELLRDVGVSWIHPGIESLRPEILKWIDKRFQAWNNVQFLKWIKESEVRTPWELIVGFPGETDSSYSSIAEWVPLLLHLQVPTGTGQLRFDRFSPYQLVALNGA